MMAIVVAIGAAIECERREAFRIDERQNRDRDPKCSNYFLSTLPTPRMITRLRARLPTARGPRENAEPPCEEDVRGHRAC